MVHIVDYPTVAATRDHMKDVFDANARGQMVTAARGSQVAAIAPADKLRAYFAQTILPGVEVARDGETVTAFMQDRPFVSAGETIDAAIDDLVLTLREYAEDFDERLSAAPNHEQNWGLVQLVKLSDDETLKAWLLGK